jgi:hypothetical protein
MNASIDVLIAISTTCYSFLFFSPSSNEVNDSSIALSMSLFPTVSNSFLENSIASFSSTLLIYTLFPFLDYELASAAASIFPNSLLRRYP